MSVGDMALPAWKYSRPGGTGYPADAEAWNRWYTENDLSWAPASSSVRAMLNGLAPGRALDLGAGDGRNAVWLAGRGWHVTAMDFSAAALDIGRGRAFAEGVTDLIVRRRRHHLRPGTRKPGPCSGRLPPSARPRSRSRHRPQRPGPNPRRAVPVHRPRPGRPAGRHRRNT